MPRQNVYDNAAFFNAYQQMRANGAGLNEDLEQPALRSLLPDVTALTCVDLGCGDGALCRRLIDRGAACVTGIDPSTRMLELARAATNNGRIEYIQSFAEDLELPAASVDLVVSSLAFHYLDDASFTALMNSVVRWLRPSGLLVASMEHPVATAGRPNGPGPDWVIDQYGEEGPRDQTWFIDGVIKHHRTLATILNTATAAGLVIERILEPTATRELLQRRPDLALHRKRPPLLLVRARRGKDRPR